MINARVSGRSWRKNLAGISTKGARAVNGRDRIERGRQNAKAEVIAQNLVEGLSAQVQKSYAFDHAEVKQFMGSRTFQRPWPRVSAILKFILYSFHRKHPSSTANHFQQALASSSAEPKMNINNDDVQRGLFLRAGPVIRLSRRKKWEAAMKRRETEPAGAITLARTLLEDVCKWIIHEAGEEWAESDDLPILYRKLAKILKLAPDDHTEQVFRQILGSCQSIVESLGSLRNKLGDAHSIGRRRARPAPRHAELAVNLSGAMSTFLVSTWKAMQDNG